MPCMFFYPHDNTVLAYISKIVQDRVLVTIIHISEVINEVSLGLIENTGFQWPISPNLFKITRVTIDG